MRKQKAIVQRKPNTPKVVSNKGQKASTPKPSTAKPSIAKPTTAKVIEKSSGETKDTELPIEEAKAIELRLQETINELKEFKSMVNGMTSDYISRLTDAVREIKQLRKTQKKPRPTNVQGPKKPCTFELPSLLSDNMCTFLNLPLGSSMSQNDVTHAIHKYCKQNGLLQSGDNRIINPDEALLTVLSPVPEGVTLTYFTVQRYLKHNYTRTHESTTNPAEIPSNTD
jgi:chromatin remodeling complex protein RSC6